MASNKGSFGLAACNNWIIRGAKSNDFVLFTGNSNQSFVFGCSNTSNLQLIITSNSFVGIGTSNPLCALDINGDLNFSGNIMQNNAPFITSQFTTTGCNVSINSNVGIGKTPVYPLDVVGDINFTGNLYKNATLYNPSQGYSNLVYASSNIITTSITTNTSNDSFRWLAGPSSNELMRLSGKGHLTLPGATNNYALTDYGVSNLYMPAYATGTIIVDSNSPFDARYGDGCFAFNGTASNNICLSNSIYSFNWWQNGGFTIEAWVNYSSFTNAALGTTYPALVGCMQAFTNADYWSFGAKDSGVLAFQYFNGTGNFVNATTTLALNTWYHVALTYDMTNIRIFQNGTLVNTPVAVSGTPQIAVPFTIGNVGNAYPNVKISNMRYVKGAALYTASFTPPSMPLDVAASGTTILLLKAPQEPSRMMPTKIGGTTIDSAYPPAALTASTTTLSNVSYGIGSYTVTASSAANPAINAFDNSTSTEWTTSVAYSTTSPYATTLSTTTTDVYGIAYTGEYIQIQLPISITLSSYSIGGAATIAQSPGQWRVLGSPNGVNWYLVNHQANIAWASSTAKVFDVIRGNAYIYYRFVISRTTGNGSCSINEIKLYGQQESIYINPDGLVGIGTKRPQQALDVTGTVNATAFAGNGASVTSLNAGNITTGTLAVAQGGTGISTATGTTGTGNIVLSAAPTFTGTVTAATINATTVQTGATTRIDSTGIIQNIQNIVGLVISFAGTTVPTGWLLCAGQNVSRSVYSALYAIIGTTYGVGDGSTTFGIPDLRGRFIAGKDDMDGTAVSRITVAGSGITGTTLGATGGAETVTLTAAQSGVPAHTHSINDPGHNHAYSLPLSGGGSGTGGGYFNNNTFYTSTTGSATTGISINANSGSAASQAHNNIPPAIVLNYIIKI